MAEIINDPIQTFIDRVDRLEKRYAKAEYKYVDAYMMPRELMKALRDELKAPSLHFDTPAPKRGEMGAGMGEG